MIALVERNFENAQKLAYQLTQAINDGVMTKADEYTAGLLRLANRESCIEIDEAEWQVFLKAVRKKSCGFVSSFLLGKKEIEIILSSDLPHGFEKIISLAEQVKSKNTLLLELPFNSEISEV
jgi:hypothetical protein